MVHFRIRILPRRYPNIFDVQSDGGVECTAQLSASVRHTIEPRWGVWLVYHLSRSRGSQGVVSASASRAYARRKSVDIFR